MYKRQFFFFFALKAIIRAAAAATPAPVITAGIKNDGFDFSVFSAVVSVMSTPFKRL